MNATYCLKDVKITIFIVLLFLFSPFVLCTPKVQNVDFDAIDGVYSKGEEYMLFVLKDMGTLKTFQFQPIGRGYEKLGLLMPYVFREPNELCEVRDDGSLKQVGRVHLKKDGSLVVSGNSVGGTGCHQMIRL